jgi:hypothetical protein
MVYCADFVYSCICYDVCNSTYILCTVIITCYTKIIYVILKPQILY